MSNPALEVGPALPPIQSPMIEVRGGNRGYDEPIADVVVEVLRGVDMMASRVWAQYFALLADKQGIPGPPGPSGAASPWVVDTYANPYTADLTLGWNHEVTATGDIGIQVPTGGTSGQPVNIRIIQDATGGRVITLASGWKLNRPAPGYQEANTSCLISGIYRDASTILVMGIMENIAA